MTFDRREVCKESWAEWAKSGAMKGLKFDPILAWFLEKPRAPSSKISLAKAMIGLYRLGSSYDWWDEAWQSQSPLCQDLLLLLVDLAAAPHLPINLAYGFQFWKLICQYDQTTANDWFGISCPAIQVLHPIPQLIICNAIT